MEVGALPVRANPPDVPHASVRHNHRGPPLLRAGRSRRPATPSRENGRLGRCVQYARDGVG
eukprot:scaffold126184_cov66-Phaeocystis_antarctica.AAC.1